MKLSLVIYALLIQIFSLVLLFLGYRAVNYFVHVYIALWTFLLIHSLFSASISYFLSIDWWWSLIHFVFPHTVYLAMFLELSPNIYLIAFICFSLVFWSIYKTRVPYYPSKASLIPHLLNYFPPDKYIQFIDVGSGLGGLLIDLKKLRPQSSFFGVEIAPITFLISLVRVHFKKMGIQIKLGNLDNQNLNQFDIVFCYLSPAAMPSIWQKAQKEMKPGSILFSYEFIIPNVKPDIFIEIEEDGSFLYGWCR